jgi:hypothetical protein
MTLSYPNETYLNIASPPVAVTSANVGTVVLSSVGPDVGQFWLPTLVHVYSSKGLPCNADLYAGAPKGMIASNYLKDSTVRGDNDSTTILSGTIIHAGETITVAFTGAALGDVLGFQVYGITTVAPPPYGRMPDVPGARFTFADTTAFSPVFLNNVFINGTGVLTVPATSGVQIVPDPSVAVPGAVYVGALKNIFVFLRMRSGPPVNQGIRLMFQWFSSAAAQAQHRIAVDVIDNVLSGGVQSAVAQTLPVKGPYMAVLAASNTNNSQADCVIADAGWNPSYANGYFSSGPPYTLPGSDRSQLLSVNLAVSVGGGGVFNTDPVGAAPGPAVLLVDSDDSPAWFADLVANDYTSAQSLVYHTDSTHPGWVSEQLILPALPVILSIHNTDASARTFRYSLIRPPYLE